MVMKVQFLAFAICVVARAASASDAPGLTLQAALDEALRNNPELIAIRAAVDAERHHAPHERALMPPMLEAQIWRWPLDAINPSRATYMFVAQQDLPGFGKRALRERLATADAEVASAGLVARARDIVADVRRTYAELFVSRRTVDVADERLALLRQLAEASQIRYAAGKTTQQDVLKAVVEISRLHADRTMDDERARMAAARLNALLGRDPGAEIGMLAVPREQVALRPVAALQALAIERQPDLAVSRAEIARAEAALAVADSARKPDFFVKGGYMAMGGERDALTASVGMTWPGAPWARKGIDAARRQARASVTAARARLDAEANRVRLMVQEAYIRAESAAERAALLRTSVVPQSTQALDVSRVGYQADRGEFIEIVDNQRVLAEARLGYYRALSELEQARADLERAAGAAIEQEFGVETTDRSER
jgi:outer membrane protein TolC